MSLHLGPIVRSLFRQRVGSALVILELATGFAAITCVLLASTWYYRLTNRPSGFDPSSLVMITLERPTPSFEEEAGMQTAALTDKENAGRIRGVRYVEALAPVSGGMLDRRWNYPVEITTLEGTPRRSAGWSIYTSPEIARVLQLKVLEGAIPLGLSLADQSAVTVITRCVRERLFPRGTAAVGRLVRSDDAPPAQVVAVVEDVVLRDPWNASGSCVSLRFGWPAEERQARYLVRASPGRRQSVVVGLRAELGETGPERRVAIEPFDLRSAFAIRMARGLVKTLAVFGAIVVLIALLGTLTVSSFLVTMRTRSIGIRRALGAEPRDIVRYFLLETCLLGLLGMGLGLLLTGLIFLQMQRLYPGLELGWRPLALTALLLGTGAVLGALLPARRAAQIPPRTAASA